VWWGPTSYFFKLTCTESSFERTNYTSCLKISLSLGNNNWLVNITSVDDKILFRDLLFTWNVITVPKNYEWTCNLICKIYCGGINFDVLIFHFWRQIPDEPPNFGSCGNRVFLRTLFLHKNENKILTLHEAYFFQLHLIQTWSQFSMVKLLATIQYYLISKNKTY
jgi:hypothetical protein